MRQIEKDTFKDGGLFYGGKDSEQRKRIDDYRLNLFFDCFIDKYPEIYLSLPKDKIGFLRKFKSWDCKEIPYKGFPAILEAIDSLENITNHEYSILISRFKRSLNHNKDEIINYFSS